MSEAGNWCLIESDPGTGLINIFVSCVSDPDPYHWAESGSTSGNVDLDPGTKKKS